MNSQPSVVWLFLLMLLGVTCPNVSAEEEHSSEELVFLMSAKLEALNGVSASLVCERMIYGDVNKAKRFALHFEKKIESLKGDSRNNHAVRALEEEKQYKEKLYASDRSSKITLYLKLKSPTSFYAYQLFNYNGSQPYEYYIDEDTGFMVRESERRVRPLSGTIFTLSIISPGIPYFWIIPVLSSGFQIQRLDEGEDKVFVKLAQNGSDAVYEITFDKDSFNILELVKKNHGAKLLELTAKYDIGNSTFPNESIVKHYRSDGSPESSDKWSLTGVNSIQVDSFSTRYAVPNTYTLTKE